MWLHYDQPMVSVYLEITENGGLSAQINRNMHIQCQVKHILK